MYQLPMKAMNLYSEHLDKMKQKELSKNKQSMKTELLDILILSYIRKVFW